MATVEFQSASKSYGHGMPLAVADLNLVCREGELLALLGPSGCGKSSTLKMAAGLEDLTEGEILFGGRPVSALPAGKRNIAMVFEDYCLYPNLTVAENIEFPLAVRSYGKHERRQRVGEILAILGLRDIAGRKVTDLSGGAQQRVAIGRAIIRDPDLILFDEPLSHLDGDQRIHLRAEISRLQKSRGVTSILVTHDQNEATAMADRIAIMKGGILQQVDTPARLYARPANVFVANFIGEPPMNLFSGEIAPAPGRIWIPMLATDIVISDERRRLLETRRTPNLTLGLRPEHLIVESASADHAANALVTYREPRGDADSLMLNLLQGDQPPLIAELAGPTAFRAGERVHLRILAANTNLFDAESGVNLELET